MKHPHDIGVWEAFKAIRKRAGDRMFMHAYRINGSKRLEAKIMDMYEELYAETELDNGDELAHYGMHQRDFLGD